MSDEKQVIGDIQFWNGCIVHYRNKGNKARSVKQRIEYAKCLCECRHWLKYAEKRILQGVLVILILLTIFSQGCQTFKGAMGDTAWILKTGADNIQIKE